MLPCSSPALFSHSCIIIVRGGGFLSDNGAKPYKAKLRLPLTNVLAQRMEDQGA
jgi:hypothetical protein